MKKKRQKTFRAMWFFVGARGGSPLARYYLLHTSTQDAVKKVVCSGIPFKNTPLQEKEICRSPRTLCFGL